MRQPTVVRENNDTVALCSRFFFGTSVAYYAFFLQDVRRVCGSAL